MAAGSLFAAVRRWLKFLNTFCSAPHTKSPPALAPSLLGWGPLTTVEITGFSSSKLLCKLQGCSTIMVPCYSGSELV